MNYKSQMPYLPKHKTTAPQKGRGGTL